MVDFHVDARTQRHDISVLIVCANSQMEINDFKGTKRT